MNELLCKECDKVAEFERPDVSDMDDGFDDFELMCVLCGTAITFGGMLLTADRVERAA